MNNRPAALTVLAILSIIWGAGATLMTFVGWIMYRISMGPPNPALEELKHSPVYLAMLFGLGFIGLLLALALLAGGIGGTFDKTLEPHDPAGVCGRQDRFRHHSNDTERPLHYSQNLRSDD